MPWSGVASSSQGVGFLATIQKGKEKFSETWKAQIYIDSPVYI